MHIARSVGLDEGGIITSSELRRMTDHALARRRGRRERIRRAGIRKAFSAS